MTSGEEHRWVLGHQPALDGLRGVAILMVVASHLQVDSLVALGGVGVTVFFTLSGFLITALLLGEFGKSGRMSMSAFYRRRIVRLVPAFLMMLAVVVPMEIVLFGSAPYWWATVLEVGNWVSAIRGPQQLELLHHTWSLAIEEQFYLIWPVALYTTMRAFGRWGVTALVAVGLAASLVASTMVTGYRQAYGTDTNAFALLAGSLLAVLMVNRRVWAAPRVTVLGALMLESLSFMTGWQVLGPAVPVATCLVIWSGTTRGAGWLAGAPLRAAGRISYGWYLWNYPVAMLAILGGFAMVMVPFASLGLALVSWRYVEQPIMSLGRRYTRSVAVAHSTQASPPIIV